jgi:hypothetical protein
MVSYEWCWKEVARNRIYLHIQVQKVLVQYYKTPYHQRSFSTFILLFGLEKNPGVDWLEPVTFGTYCLGWTWQGTLPLSSIAWVERQHEHAKYDHVILNTGYCFITHLTNKCIIGMINIIRFLFHIRSYTKKVKYYNAWSCQKMSSCHHGECRRGCLQC